MSKSNRQHSKALYCWGTKRRGRIRKPGNVEVKRKWWVLVQPPYSTKGNGRQTPWVETTRIDHPKRRIREGAGIVKGWEDK